MGKKGKALGKSKSSGKGARFLWRDVFTASDLEAFAKCTRTKDDEKKSIWQYLIDQQEVPQKLFAQMSSYLSKNPSAQNLLEETDENGNTPLGVAIQAANFEAVTALIHFKANIERAFSHRGWVGELVQHFALEEVQALIMQLQERQDRFAVTCYNDIDATTKTSVFEMIVESKKDKFRNDKEWIAFLLKQGFLPHSRIGNQHPLYWLLRYDQTMAKNALANAPTEIVYEFDAHNQNVLFAACYYGDAALFKTLMDLHPNPHHRSATGQTVAHILATATDSLAEFFSEKETKVAQKLANIIYSQQDGEGVVDVLNAVIEGAVRVTTGGAATMVTKDAVIQHLHTNMHGKSESKHLSDAKSILETLPQDLNFLALNAALRLVQSVKELGLLIQAYRVDLGAVDKNGDTALMLACRRNNTYFMGCIVRNSPVEHYNKCGENALSITFAEGHHDATDLLVRFMQKENPEALTKLVNGPCHIPEKMRDEIKAKFSVCADQALPHAQSVISMSVLSLALYGTSMFQAWILTVTTGFDRKVWLKQQAAKKVAQDDIFKVAMALDFSFRDIKLNRDITAKNCIEMMLRYGVSGKDANVLDAYLQRGKKKRDGESLSSMIDCVLRYLDPKNLSENLARIALRKIPLKHFPVYLLEEHADVMMDIFTLKILESPLLYHAFNEMMHVMSRYDIGGYASVIQDSNESTCLIRGALATILVKFHNHKVRQDCTPTQKRILVERGYLYGTDNAPNMVPELSADLIALVQQQIPSDIDQASDKVYRQLDEKWRDYLSAFLDHKSDGALKKDISVEAKSTTALAKPEQRQGPRLKVCFFGCFNKVVRQGMLQRVEQADLTQIAQALKLVHSSSSGEVRHAAFMVAADTTIEQEKVLVTSGGFLSSALNATRSLNILHPNSNLSQFILTMPNTAHTLNSMAEAARTQKFDQNKLMQITIKMLMEGWRTPKKIHEDAASSSENSLLFFDEVTRYIMQDTGFWDGAVFLGEWLVDCPERRVWLEQSENQECLLRYLAIEFEKGNIGSKLSKRALGALACFKKVQPHLNFDFVLDALNDIPEKSGYLTVFFLNDVVFGYLGEDSLVKKILSIVRKNTVHSRCSDTHHHHTKSRVAQEQLALLSDQIVRLDSDYARFRQDTLAQQEEYKQLKIENDNSKQALKASKLAVQRGESETEELRDQLREAIKKGQDEAQKALDYQQAARELQNQLTHTEAQLQHYSKTEDKCRQLEENDKKWKDKEKKWKDSATNAKKEHQQKMDIAMLDARQKENDILRQQYAQQQEKVQLLQNSAELAKSTVKEEAVKRDHELESLRLQMVRLQAELQEAKADLAGKNDELKVAKADLTKKNQAYTEQGETLRLLREHMVATEKEGAHIANGSNVDMAVQRKKKSGFKRGGAETSKLNGETETSKLYNRKAETGTRYNGEAETGRSYNGAGKSYNAVAETGEWHQNYHGHGMFTAGTNKMITLTDWFSSAVGQVMGEAFAFGGLGFGVLLRGSLAHCWMRNNDDEKEKWIDAFHQGEEDVDVLIVVNDEQKLLPLQNILERNAFFVHLNRSWILPCSIGGSKGGLHVQLKHSRAYMATADAASYVWNVQANRWVLQALDYQHDFIKATGAIQNGQQGAMTMYWALHQLVKQLYYIEKSSAFSYLQALIVQHVDSGKGQGLQETLQEIMKKFAKTRFRAAMTQAFIQSRELSPALFEVVQEVVSCPETSSEIDGALIQDLALPAETENVPK